MVWRRAAGIINSVWLPQLRNFNYLLTRASSARRCQLYKGAFALNSWHTSRSDLHKLSCLTLTPSRHRHTCRIMVTSNDILQHAPLALYMIAVVGLSVNLAPLPRNGKSTAFILLAIGSLGITWKYMLDYMYRSFLDHLARAGIFQATTYRSTQWLQETSLFDEAWRYVCSTPDRWWFSSQLCLFTVGVFTVFLHAEGKTLSFLFLEFMRDCRYLTD